MTRKFNENVFCPHCRQWHPAENAFNQWVRRHPQLDSRDVGIARFDCDVLIHRYKVARDGMGDRTIQCLMFIEVKTHGADASDAQLDTLGLLSQVLRNRRRNRHREKIGRHLADHTPPAVAHSRLLGRKVALRVFGGHLLQLSGNDPTDSEWMKWDWRDINAEQLVRLLLFELDPDWKKTGDGKPRLREMDTRRRYRSVRQLFGFTCETCGEEFDEEVYHCPLCNGHTPVGEKCRCQ